MFQVSVWNATKKTPQVILSRFPSKSTVQNQPRHCHTPVVAVHLPAIKVVMWPPKLKKTSLKCLGKGLGRILLRKKTWKKWKPHQNFDKKNAIPFGEKKQKHGLSRSSWKLDCSFQWISTSARPFPNDPISSNNAWSQYLIYLEALDYELGLGGSKKQF